MKTNKTQKGITLVALIITIIVLLILAVVAIRAVQGDGIIAHAKNARDNYNQAQIEENGVLKGYEDYITGQIGGSSGGGESNVDHTTEEFNKMATNVNKYHGFYVGRYEMSYDTTNNKAQSVKGATSLGNSTAENNWYGLYVKAKTYAPESSNKSVVSSMIYGSQYNAMMTWMGEATNNKIGNDRNTDRTTGTKETDFINNVYDLYGNSYEWTQEANDTVSRVSRGGDSGGDYSPSYRNNSSPAYTVTDGYYASRLALYVK